MAPPQPQARNSNRSADLRANGRTKGCTILCRNYTVVNGANGISRAKLADFPQPQFAVRFWPPRSGTPAVMARRFVTLGHRSGGQSSTFGIYGGQGHSLHLRAALLGRYADVSDPVAESKFHEGPHDCAAMPASSGGNGRALAPTQHPHLIYQMPSARLNFRLSRAVAASDVPGIRR